VVVPSRKVTVPVGSGVLPAGPATVAVNVTGSPGVDGFADDVIDVVVLTKAAAFTTCVRAADVLAANSPFPEYAAVIEWLP
jgi:hypothetical protein